MKSFLLVFLLFSSIVRADQKDGNFAGRITRVNIEASLVKVKVDFNNMKYVNKKDVISFWHELSPNYKCKGYVAGKTSEYLLIKMQDVKYCEKYVPINPGMYLSFFSKDLVNNIMMGKELVQILLKKRLAMNGQMSRAKQEMQSSIERINSVNQRYKILRDKLELEWRGEIGALEEDQATALQNYKNLEISLGELDHKLEKYRISDENLKVDRWAIDPQLYYKK